MTGSKPNKIRTLLVWKILEKETDRNHPMSIKDIQEKLIEFEISSNSNTLKSDINTIRNAGFKLEELDGKEKKYYSSENSESNLQKNAFVKVMHEALHSGMWTMDFNEDGKMTDVTWSDEFRKMIGYNDTTDFPNTLEAWSDKLHKDDYERVLKEYNDTILDYTDKKSYDVEYRLKVKNGDWKWFHAMGKLLRRNDGSPKTYVGMFVDITEKKQTEQKRLLTLEKAEEASRAKSTFLSHMSHDIRTPINGIMGMTEIAFRHLDDKEKTKDCLEKIEGASQHLLMLINDVLDMSRIEAGKLVANNAPFELDSLIANCSSIIGGQIKTRDIHYSHDYSQVKHHHLIGDELHLRQVFINILGNSVKFTKDGGSISFSARETNFENGKASIRFVIEDTGVGMSPEFLPKIFESFTQENNTSRTTYTGTGLGMAITKQFVDLMGGKIYVESELNVGTKTTIDITFDISEEEEEKKKETNSSKVDLTGMNVLIAEDNEINMEIATVLLSESGVTVTQAYNGKEAVEIFEKSDVGSFDMILMDVMMPIMNGLDATRAIRSLNRADAKTIPIIAATANAYEEDIRKTREAGMNAHVTKPLDFDVLISLMKKYQSSI